MEKGNKVDRHILFWVPVPVSARGTSFLGVYFSDEYLFNEHRFYSSPELPSIASEEGNPRVYRAVIASRSARFEFGENGGVK